MGKYNLEDSMEFQNLKKYAEEAMKMRDKDAALEAILLEYSKDRPSYTDGHEQEKRCV